MPVILSVLFTTFLFAQMEDIEGKEWLDTFTEPAAMNVTGLWSTKQWGRISLSQHEGSRKILGGGDGWEISGVVSGNTVCLLFTHKGKVAFSAKLTAEGPTLLSGVYAKGMLSPTSDTTPIQLQK
jgi:hypothetical protein